MSDQLDYKKKYKDLYQPKAVPTIVDVPKMKFIMIDGKGNPNDESGEYVKAVELLYGLSYTIKMSNKSGNAPSDFFEYVVPPLEGLWWTEIDRPFDTSQKDKLIWTAMIRQPEFVTDEVFKWAVDVLKQRKPKIDTAKARLEEFTEGLCVQMMHFGSYDTEAATVKAIDDFAASNGYLNAISETGPDGTIRRHHEIYLSDPRKVAPEKIKTVIRHPIRKQK
ncbi:MAG: GyrI-like domain-containing protein [Syntrophomonadaceae bacterium]